MKELWIDSISHPCQPTTLSHARNDTIIVRQEIVIHSESREARSGFREKRFTKDVEVGRTWVVVSRFSDSVCFVAWICRWVKVEPQRIWKGSGYPHGMGCRTQWKSESLGFMDLCSNMGRLEISSRSSPRILLRRDLNYSESFDLDLISIQTRKSLVSLLSF